MFCTAIFGLQEGHYLALKEVLASHFGTAITEMENFSSWSCDMVVWTLAEMVALDKPSRGDDLSKSEGEHLSNPDEEEQRFRELLRSLKASIPKRLPKAA